MKKITKSLALTLPFFLTACGGSDFSGNYQSSIMGLDTKFTFDGGELRISNNAGNTLLTYEYDEEKNEIIVGGPTENDPKEIINIREDGTLKMAQFTLTPIK